MSKHLNIIPNKGEIYASYQELLPSIKLLKDWLQSLLKEMKDHIAGIHAYQIRIKSPESIFNNLYYRDRNAKIEIGNLDEYILNLPDLLGARLIFQHSTGVLNFNDNVFSLERFKIKEVQFHDVNELWVFKEYKELWKNIHSKEIKHLANDDLIKHSYNDRGYLGIHYHIQPKFSRSYYLEHKINTLGHFELQLRTMLQNAWSEVQHYMVYKNSNAHNEDIKTAINRELYTAAKLLKTIDESITKLYDYNLAPSNSVNRAEIPKQFDEFNSNLLELKEALEQSKTREDEIIKAKEFYENHISTFDMVIQNTEPKFVIFYYEVAEFLLRADLNDKAYDLYKAIERFEYTADYGFTYLRHAEVELKKQQIDNVEMYLDKFQATNYKNESSHNLEDKQLRYYYEALRISWRASRTRFAIDFGNVILSYLDKFDDRDFVFYLLNINYRISNNLYDEKQDSLVKIQKLIDPYKTILLKLDSKIDKYEKEVPNLLYKLAYIKYIIYLFEHKSDKLLQEATDHIAKFWNLAKDTEDKYKSKAFKLLELIARLKN